CYASSGGDVTSLERHVEDNLLGTATSLIAVYNHTPDRNIFTLGYVSPHFFSRRVRLQALYSAKTDGKRGDWLVGVPFYETAARHALRIDGPAASERGRVCRDGGHDTTRTVVPDTTGAVERRALRFGVTAGFAPHATTRDYLRLWVS